MTELYQQLLCLFAFVITGIAIGILFDIFRIARKSFKTADWLTYIQDILFWILAGIIMLFSIFTFNNGEIRSYVFMGMAIGIIIYMITISKFLIHYSVAIIQFFKKILSYPIHFVEKIIKIIIINPFLFLGGKLKKVSHGLYKFLHNVTKCNKKKKKKAKKTKENEGILEKM